jgi:hypothetical protein
VVDHLVVDHLPSLYEAHGPSSTKKKKKGKEKEDNNEIA